MPGASRQVAPAAAVLSAALALSACGHGAPAAGLRHLTSATSPVRIMSAPASLRAVTVPQANGISWGLAGQSSRGLFQLGAFSWHARGGSVSVSGAARSVAASAEGVVGVALGSRRSGALELLDSHTARPTATIALPAPARQVVAGSDGTTFYVLTAWPRSASVSVVSSRTGRISGTVPVPAGTVSVAPDPAQTALYVLQSNGLVDEISMAGGKISASFRAGDNGISLALSPDGSTLYVLKGSASVANVAVVQVSTESVRRVLPAPSHCREVLVSANGRQLFEVVGATGYGNIQVFAV
jgi:DNA-binding beta-propeller fold protein YncE